jgi:replicative DNA helicase
VTTTDNLSLQTARRPQTATSALDTLRRPDPLGRAARSPDRTGFSPLDDVLAGGVRPGELLLMGGKPGKGKTVAVLQWARQMARNGTRALFVCFEHASSSLLIRLLSLELAEIAIEDRCTDQLRLEDLRLRLQALATDPALAGAILASDPYLWAAEERVRAYGHRLELFEGSRTTSDLAGLDQLVAERTAEPCTLFVDYLQKLPSGSNSGSDDERVGELAEGLKELAMRHAVPVVAVVAADQTGLSARRTKLQHFRGSSALAYEADTVIMLNDKLSIVSRAHLAYDTTRIHEFRDQVVFSVEKNRAGLTDVDLEYRRDFASYRFDPCGSWVSERLWDEGSVDD